MHNAEEFSGQRSGFRRMLPTYGRAGSGVTGRGSGRIRYAHGGPPRVEPLCTVPQGSGHHAGAASTAETVAATGAAGAVDAWGLMYSGTSNSGAWLTEVPVGGRHSDMWVLVCGGIVAVSAFAAAFVASGGLASHPAAPGATPPAVMSQACPSPVAGPTP